MSRLSVMAAWPFSSVGSLTQRTARAGFWLLIGDGIGRIAGFLKLVILARLLAPADFGVMGIALLVTAWAEYFTELGFSAALIQKRGDIRPYLATAWSVHIIRGILLAVIITASASLIGEFFNEPSAVPVIQILALQTAIRGFRNPAVIYLRKELDTRREVVLRLTGAAAGLAAGVPAAFLLRNVWALVLSLLAASLVETLGSFWVRPYRPALQLEWTKAHELIRLGRWMLSLHLVGFITGHLDVLVIGKAVGAVPLGFYQMARQLTLVPLLAVGTHMHGVLFPAFASMDNDALRRLAFLRALAVTSSIAVPVAFFLTIFGDVVVQVALGPKWSGTEDLVMILAWAGTIRAIAHPASALFLAIGNPSLDFKTALPKVAILLALVYPAAQSMGTIGVALTVTAASLASLLYQLVLAARLTRIPTSELSRTFRSGLLASLPLVAWKPLSLLPSPTMTVVLAVVAMAASAAILGRSLSSALRSPLRGTS
jgi:lipopolysaccharide exporter